MKGLLEEVCLRAGCRYLSDIKQCSWERLQQALSEIPVELYSLREWGDAVQYLTGETKMIETKEQAVKLLLGEEAESLEEQKE